jgi:hypothetical protein
VQTSSPGEASASHSKFVEDSKPEPETATESIPRPIKAPSSLHFSVQEGEEVELQIARGAGLHEDPIYDDPSGGRGSYQTLESHGGFSSTHDETGKMKDSLQSAMKRVTIPHDGELHKCHGQNVTVPDSLPKASCFDGK